jgi:hypothetical protein
MGYTSKQDHFFVLLRLYPSSAVNRVVMIAAKTTRYATMEYDPTSPPGGVLRHAYAYVRVENGLD